MTTHTPGPWRKFEVVGPSYFDQLPQEAQEFLRGVGFEPHGEDDDTGWGMTKCGCLFVLPADDFDFRWCLCPNHSAAPELLEALSFCASVLHTQGLYELSEQIAYDKANTAIAKAKGEA